MRTAIATGSDPNELDGMGKHQIGRPLHYAIANEAGHEFVKENLPIVKLLLEAGADPRLPALTMKSLPTYGQSALDESKQWLDVLERSGGKGWSEEDIALKPFYNAAYREMKKIADKLDGMLVCSPLELILTVLQQRMQLRNEGIYLRRMDTTETAHGSAGSSFGEPCAASTSS